MPARPAAGGGRWVEIDPDRLGRWLDGFAQRHGAAQAQPGVEDDAVLVLSAPDGATAELFAPPGLTYTGDDVAGFVAAASVPRRLGLVLARQASIAAGIAVGAELIASKVDSSYVQGRTAAGGWSQQRFARRRVNQAKAAAGSAADIVVRLLLPELDRLDAVVAGGDRRAVDAALADPRLAALRAMRSNRFLTVPEPRLTVLEQAVVAARSVHVRIREQPQEQ